MKVKSLGLASLGVLALSAAGTAGYVVLATNLVTPAKSVVAAKPAAVAAGKPGKPGAPGQPEAPGKPAEEKKGEVPSQDPQVLDAVNRLQHQLASLSQPRIPEKGEVNLQLLGYSSASIRKNDAVEMAGSEDYSTRVVTMSYTAGQEKFAVIDDRLYLEGDKLDESGEATVRSIEPTKVLVAGKEVRQWLEVKNSLLSDEDVNSKKKAAQDAAKQAKEAKLAPVASEGAKPIDKLDKGAATPGNAIEALKDYKDILNQLNPNK